MSRFSAVVWLEIALKVTIPNPMQAKFKDIAGLAVFTVDYIRHTNQYSIKLYESLISTTNIIQSYTLFQINQQLFSKICGNYVNVKAVNN